MSGLFILGIFFVIAGFIFVAVETIVPGFGAPGILGGICLVAGVFLTADTIQQALVIITIIAVLLAVMIFIIITFLSKGKLKPPIILSAKQEKDSGYISSADLQYLVGEKGIATTDLHPSGRVMIKDKEFDVISDGRFIEKNSTVEVYAVSNSSPVVRAVQ
jgi:membrane-bound ClpP family serine protease